MVIRKKKTYPKILRGTGMIPGIAAGKVLFKKHLENTSIHSSENFKKLLPKAIIYCEEILASASPVEAEHLKTQLLFLQDPLWQEKVMTYLSETQNFSRAIIKTHQFFLKKLENNQQLIHKIDDLKHLDQFFFDQHKTAKASQEPFILCAKELSVHDLIHFDSTFLKGIIVEDQTAFSHCTILARSKNIPLVTNLKEITSRLKNRESIIIDGEKGYVYLNHKQDNTFLPNKEKITADSSQIIYTRDDVKVRLYLNIHGTQDIDILHDFPFSGIGLYRTEFLFFQKKEWPTVAEQQEEYKLAIQKCKDRPIIFRTLDVRGDKVFLQNMPLPNLQNKKIYNSNNDFASIIRLQIRAIIRAYAAVQPIFPLKIMFPMVCDAEELEFYLQLLNIELERERQQKGTVIPYSVGVMIEVPSTLFQLERLTQMVDFVSVGSNDLFHFLYATNRAEEKNKTRDILSIAFLKTLKNIFDVARNLGKDVHFCGEMASDPVEAMALLGLGYRHLSISLPNVEKILETFMNLDVWPIQDIVNEYLISEGTPYLQSGPTIRQKIEAVALAQGSIKFA